MSFDSMTADRAIPNFSRELGYTQLKKENPIKYWVFSVKTEILGIQGVRRLGIQKQGEFFLLLHKVKL